MTKHFIQLFVLGFFLIFFSLSVSGQTVLMKVEEKDKKKDPRFIKYGWHGLLKASVNASFGQSKSVVGMDDGISFSFGTLILGALNYYHKTGHEWSNTLKWQLGYGMTPLIEGFAKSMDDFDFLTSYFYHIPKMDWFGPFAFFQVKTAIFKSYLLYPTAQNITVLDNKGNPIDQFTREASKQIAMTAPFSPTILKQGVGLFADPLRQKRVNIHLQLGLGSWETFVQNGFTLADDKASLDTVEIKEMVDSIQIGGELSLTIFGAWSQYITYRFRTAIMYPFYHNVDTNITGWDLTNFESEAAIGVRLWKWASLDYMFKAYRYPLISYYWQIQNLLLFSATVSIL